MPVVSFGQTSQPTLRGRALRLLARREWSRETLRAKLLSVQLSTRREDTAPLDVQAVDALLEDFATRGWLSDKRYAEALVRSRQDRYGKTAIARRLKQAGVSDEVADQALVVMDSDHEYQTAMTLLNRKFRGLPADDKDKARRVRFLQARGFSLNLAYRIMKSATGSE